MSYFGRKTMIAAYKYKANNRTIHIAFVRKIVGENHFYYRFSHDSRTGEQSTYPISYKGILDEFSTIERLKTSFNNLGGLGNAEILYKIGTCNYEI